MTASAKLRESSFGGSERRLAGWLVLLLHQQRFTPPSLAWRDKDDALLNPGRRDHRNNMVALGKQTEPELYTRFIDVRFLMGNLFIRVNCLGSFPFQGEKISSEVEETRSKRPSEFSANKGKEGVFGGGGDAADDIGN